MAGDKTIRLKVLADVADHHAKMAALPGVTQKAAAAAAVRWEKELTRSAIVAQKAHEKAAKASGDGWASASKVMAVGGAAVAGLVAGFVKLQDSIAASRDELLDAEARTGIAAETMNGLRLAAEGSGGAFADLEPLLNKFPKTMADTAKGTGSAKDAFAALGIEVANADGSLRSADTVFKEAVAALSGIEDATERAATATELFGKSGGKLLEALSGAELQNFVDMANKYGTKVGPEAAAASARWQMEMANLKNVVRGVTEGLFDFGADGGEALQVVQIGVVMLGELAKGVLGVMTDHFKSIAKGWTALFKGDVQAAMDAFAKGSVVSLVTGIADAVEKAKEAGQEYANYAVKLSDMSEATRVVTADTRDFTSSLDEELKARMKLLDEVAEYEEEQAENSFKLRQEESVRHAEDLVKKAEAEAEAADDAEAAAKLTAAANQAAAQASTQAWIGAFGAITDALFAGFQDNKQAAIAQALINGALAATMVMATIPPPLNVPALIATAAEVAGSIATINAQSVAHSGMAFGRGGQLAPDEMKITKREARGVLTARGIDNAGGPSAVAAMNRGTGGRGAVVVRNQWKHQVYDDFTGDNFARDATARRAVKALIATGAKVGKRTT